MQTQKAFLMPGLENNFYYRAVIAFHNLRDGTVAVIVVENTIPQSPAAVGGFKRFSRRKTGR